MQDVWVCQTACSQTAGYSCQTTSKHLLQVFVHVLQEGFLQEKIFPI